ncbi:ATP-binding cassette domain-containing protein [Sphingobacterium psychroaquaticum]|uniref:methionine ABC transporter ATP-binding protein n=1 Tax=Sphingobacterium psychroaquaticum TaxID=561061 RepID=UPI0010690EE4|nr:ATP-binding cassette domain-containing protein [Sphingobacterium psychroaquaticum]QBQ41827.1 ATP-binding cassette domain-containing protein [Sphingobacterium psychroaquaticum]
MIRLENIHKTFLKKHHKIEALRAINLQVDKGDIFGIIGYSGSGKSTLVRTINLLERPDKGAVYYKDVEISAFSENQLIPYRHKIGMIFQQFNLLASATVFDNIALPLRLQGIDSAAISTKVNELLVLIGLQEKKEDYPSSLSGGQKQRVAIARAIASDPEVLLCDEATSALDPQTTRTILALLQEINQRLGITIVLITHEMEVVRAICNKVAVISNGEIVEQDSVENVFAQPQSAITRELLNPSLSLHQ